MNRESGYAAQSPIAIPTPASPAPCRTTPPTMPDGVAPNADRTPISGVRCVTPYATMP
jgi:hypothetical protein